jgi:serine protease Do
MTRNGSIDTLPSQVGTAHSGKGRPGAGRPRLQRLALALMLGTCLAMGPLAPALADNVTGGASLAERLPSLAPIVDKVLPAVVNISVVQRAGQEPVPDDENDNGEDDQDDQDQAPQAHPGNPGGNPQTPFDELLRRFFEQQQQNRHGMQMPNRKITALGSGFIIDPAGYVVTNNHVVGNADKVEVILQDDSRHTAKIIGKDAKTDLALLKIEAPKPLPAVKFGDSDKARVGDWVFAVGNPFGLGGTVTKGIISARGRQAEDGNYIDFLQVDASINRGNSGGPTFDLDGDVIGINTAIFSPNGGSVGIGFAIPSNAAKIVLDQLRSSGKVDRGFLGVMIQEVTPEIASSMGLDAEHPTGALVAQVTEDSPAAHAGIKVGDLIEKFDGKTVDKMRDLPRIVAETGSGKKVDILLLRDGKTITVSTTIGQFDETQVANAQGDDNGEHTNKMASLGLSLAPLNADARKRLGIQKNVDGVLISRVRDGSPAADGGVLAGDVIVKVNGQSVGKPEEVIEQVKGTKTDSKSILLLLNRHGVNRFIALKPEEKNG